LPTGGEQVDLVPAPCALLRNAQQRALHAAELNVLDNGKCELVTSHRSICCRLGTAPALGDVRLRALRTEVLQHVRGLDVAQALQMT
jgi:hypothetical protein